MLELNKVYHGDCLDIMQKIDKGIIDLIYIDPPFGIKLDEKFGMIPWKNNTQEPNRVDELLPLADKLLSVGELNYLRWLYPRLYLMKELLSEQGSIYVHLDWHVGHYVKILLDEIFGKEQFKNEIVWCYTGNAAPGQRQYSRKHDVILWYGKNETPIFNDLDVRVPYSEKTLANFKKGLAGSSYNGETAYKEGQDQIGKLPEDWWEMAIAGRYPVDGIKRAGYPTEKPWPLIERIIKASSNKDSIIADFYAGSGIVGAVGEKLNRRWLLSDISIDAVNIANKRITDIINNKKELQ